MKRFTVVLSLALITVLALSMFGASPTLAAASKTRVFVQFSPGAKGSVENALARAGAEFHYAFDGLDAFAVTLPSAALDGISHNPNIILVEEDAPRYLIGIQESQAQAPLAAVGQTVPYGIDMVQARDVWDANRDGAIDTGAPTASNRTICIIDSGMYNAHEDLQGVNVVGGYTNITGGYLSDGLGHGTHVAGTISAMNNALGVVGVTPGTVNLYIVRVFGDDGAWAYSSTLIDAANRCYTAGANIISMSLGGGRASVTEQRGFDTLYANGVLSIAAAGNDGTTAYSYPASYSSVVSVAAIDSSKLVADFSQKNTQVEVAAPGVGVLSTVPYVETNSFTVDGVTYPANHIEFSGRGTATGALVDGGLCDSVGAWSGKAVLCLRGVIDFNTKVQNVQAGGGTTAILYNNVPGGFSGTLGAGNTAAIVALSISQEDGQFLVANKLGMSGTAYSNYAYPASGYEYYDGTSMATPHVSAVAALVWSAKTSATNVDVRNALTATAQDLGVAGRDTSYGYGLVQAKNAITYLVGTTGGALHVADLDGTKSIKGSKWTATITVKVVDANGVAVSGATVSGNWSGAKTGTATCLTGTSGTCSVVASSMTGASVTFTVTNLVKSGYTYNAAANSDPDGDSNGTAITIVK